MFNIDALSRKPIYEQIIEQIEKFVLTGLLGPGAQVPSVRSLSIELSINPNTIQKAYSELDARGVIYSVPGKGCFVCENAIAVLNEYRRRKLSDLTRTIEELALAGIEKNEIQECVEKAYTNISEKGNRAND
jgi:GntR family transcriptional regulator